MPSIEQTISSPRTISQPTISHPRPIGTQTIIQGGMGVAISDWRLARAVSRAGQLGVVSGTALDVVLTRRLQRGDEGGHVRRALAAFPVPQVAQWILDGYFVEGGVAPDAMYRPVPRHTHAPGRHVTELTVAANFVEVWLAREGHDGRVGVNYLRKIELPLPAGLYGAMLAGATDVLVGAGSPAEIPGIVRRLARHERVTLQTRVQGSRSDETLGEFHFDPRALWPEDAPLPGPLAMPRVLAIVASAELAAGLAASPDTRPGGFVVEGPSAGGHNAPPRGPRRVDELGQPVYDERDDVDLAAVLALGLPVWVAGAAASPERVDAALAAGAAGVQVGTAFAYCAESGLDAGLREQVLAHLAAGDAPSVRADWRASPTGFPFRVVELPGTWTDPSAVAARAPVCDLGVLRSAFRTEAGTIDYRCPAEPAAAYQRKGGRAANAEGRVCLCNALFATCGLPARRRGGVLEPALVTSGSDLAPVAELLRRRAVPGGAVGGSYSARDVIEYLLGA